MTKSEVESEGKRKKNLIREEAKKKINKKIKMIPYFNLWL